MSGGPFYRAAGMSFLRYTNISADLLRNVLKEPFKTKAHQQQVIAFRYSPFVDGKAGTQSECKQSCATGAGSSALSTGSQFELTAAVCVCVCVSAGAAVLDMKSGMPVKPQAPTAAQ